MFVDVHSHSVKIDTIVNFFPKQKLVDGFMFSCGIHPWYLEDSSYQIEVLEERLQHSNCLALGECGLDRKCDSDFNLQKELFKTQIVLANQYNKPLIIHCVKAFDLLLHYLPMVKVKVVIHGYNQNEHIFAQLKKHKQVLFSFGNSILIQNSNAQKMIKQLSLQRIFFETDDTEVDIARLYARAAKLLNVPTQKLELELCNNFKRVFTPDK